MLNRESLATLPIRILLIVVALLVFWGVNNCQFLKYDDQAYVTDNAHVKSGLKLDGISWALTAAPNGDWIPVTWMSYMLDSQACAGPPTGYPDDPTAAVFHRTNLILHLVNALLVFFILYELTGMRWRSAVVAALFAVHPMHVESVAWIAERKGVLSTFFLLLTIWGYTWYLKKPAWPRNLALLVLFALGVMSKSMLVSLPLLLLLLDFWPLRRVIGWAEDNPNAGRTWRQLVVEKLPLLAIAVAACGAAVWAQAHAGALRTLSERPIGERLANALISYVAYIHKTVWPTDLTCMYPHPGNTIPAWEIAASGIAIVAITGAALLAARRAPWLAVGWLWFAVSLVPVIGIIQFGAHGMADRFSYVPHIGLFVLLVWGVYGLLSRVKRGKCLAAVAAAAVIAALALVARQQVSYWHDDYALCNRALAVTRNNAEAHFTLASRYVADGRFDDAMKHLGEVVKINPRHPLVWGEIGQVYLLTNRYDRAERALVRALSVSPQNSWARLNYGVLLRQQGEIDEAITQFSEILKYSPNYRAAQDELEQTEAMK